MSEIQKLDRTRLPCLKKVEKGKLFTEERKVNQLLKKVEQKDMTVDNNFSNQIENCVDNIDYKVCKQQLDATYEEKV